MKKYVVSSLGALTLIAGSVFLSPLSASADTYVPTDPCSCGTSTVQVPDALDPALADTGSSVPMWLLGGAGAAVVAGGVILVARRRSRSAD